MKIQTKLIVTLIVVTFLMGLAGLLAIYELGQISQTVNRLPENIQSIDRASRLDGLAQLIRYYDEVLTQSARNYAFTQDEIWKERYELIEPELDRIIKQAVTEGDEEDRQLFSSIDKANIALVEMEYRAIELTNSGQPDEAIEILESDEYLEQKRIYQQGLSDYVERRGIAHIDAMRISTDTLERVTQNVQDTVDQTTQLVLITIPVVLVTAVVIGFLIFYSITKPLTGLRNAASQIARGNFDVKIDTTGDDEIGELASRFDSMRAELKNKDRLKDEFISVASHELKSPIQPILGYIDLSKKGRIKQQEAIDGILPQARRLQQLANNILDVSRIESGSLTYQIGKVRIGSVIADVVNAAKVNLNGNVSIEMELDKDSATVEIDADRSRINQVLSNIVGNAIKFTKKGIIRVECHTSIELNFVEIKVRDTGGGIPAEIFPDLFGKFVTKSVIDRNHNGTGLGLFISKAIVKAHKGTITAFNSTEGGATFVITLPILQNEKMYS